MLSWPSFGTRSTFSLGIEILTGETSLALKNDKTQRVEELAVIPGRLGHDNINADLSEFLRVRELEGIRCNVVLSTSDYQLVLMDAPEVDESEMSEAIRWQLKDRINMKLDAAAIDTFYAPEDVSKTSRRMVYSAVAEKNRIQKIVEAVLANKLQLNAIDISELALRDISCHVPQINTRDRGLGIVRLGQGMGGVYLYRGAELYMSRNFKLAYKAGLLDELPEDSLVLELQRSLDYYERQMGQALPSRLYLCGENITADKLSKTFKKALPIPIAYLDAVELLPLADAEHWRKDVDENDDECMAEVNIRAQKCIGAIGIAFRQQQTIANRVA